MWATEIIVIEKPSAKKKKTWWCFWCGSFNFCRELFLCVCSSLRDSDKTLFIFFQLIYHFLFSRRWVGFFVRFFSFWLSKKKEKTGSIVSLVCVAPAPRSSSPLQLSFFIRLENKKRTKGLSRGSEGGNDMTKASGVVDVDFICRLREGKWTLPVDSTHTHNKKRKENEKLFFSRKIKPTAERPVLCVLSSSAVDIRLQSIRRPFFSVINGPTLSPPSPLQAAKNRNTSGGNNNKRLKGFLLDSVVLKVPWVSASAVKRGRQWWIAPQLGMLIKRWRDVTHSRLVCCSWLYISLT